jgi:hypothetical protein
MAGDLEIDVVPKQPVAIEEDQDDEYTEGFEKIERVPEYVCIGGFKLPFDHGTNRIVNGIPKAQ